MAKALKLAALLLALWGAVTTYSAYTFIRDSVRITAKVIAVEELRGPPKPRQKIPLHVEFEVNGMKLRTETRMPMLGVIKEGDSIPLWVDPSNPQRVELADLANVFAAPLTYILFGAVGLFATMLYSSKSPPTSPMSTRPPAESSST